MNLAEAVIEREWWFPEPREVPTFQVTDELDQRALKIEGRVTNDSGLDEETAWTVPNVLRIALFMLAAIMLGLVLNLVVASGLEYRAAQSAAFNRLRDELALGTAPLGPREPDHSEIPLGTPIALLDIPSIGVKEVVAEGTTSAVLMAGPGHSRSTPFPGGAGTSVILGRAAAYGGPFARIDQLPKGARITVTTQVGTAIFRVVDHRRAGDLVPPLSDSGARLTLATAAGPAFLPSGVSWVDADLVQSVSAQGRTSGPLAAQKPAVRNVPPSERPLGVDTGALWSVLLWLTVLTLVLVGAFWTWRRRGHVQAWIIFSAPVVLVSLFVAGHITLLLPNLT